jgi:hypothetical protein
MGGIRCQQDVNPPTATSLPNNVAASFHTTCFGHSPTLASRVIEELVTDERLATLRPHALRSFTYASADGRSTLISPERAAVGVARSPPPVLFLCFLAILSTSKPFHAYRTARRAEFPRQALRSSPLVTRGFPLSLSREPKRPHVASTSILNPGTICLWDDVDARQRLFQRRPSFAHRTYQCSMSKGKKNR